jgi:general secretion pathway protein N
MNAAARRRLTPALTIMAAVLGMALLILLLGVGRGVRWDAPRVTPPLAPPHNVALPSPPPPDSYGQVWQHPLFSPDRKPMVSTNTGSSVSLGDLQLTGIILTPTLRMALLRDTHGANGGNAVNPSPVMPVNAGNPEPVDDAPEIRVREGTSLPDGSWKLVEVRPRSAIFTSASGRTELKLPAGAPIDKIQPAASSFGPPPGATFGHPPLAPPPPDAEQQQRILKLKAAILKQRAQQSGSAAGEH